jgi:hypothetical protein
MKKWIPTVSLFFLISCGGGSGGGNSTNATITALKNSREALGEVSRIASSEKILSSLSNKAAGTQLDDTSWNTGTWEYDASDSLSLKEFFAEEFDSSRAVGDGASNLLNRMDEALMLLCAFSIDFGEDLNVVTDKQIEVDAEAVNTQCGTKLHPEQISYTGGTGSVEDISTLEGSQYERKITVADPSADSDDVYYMTNNESKLSLAFGRSDEEDNYRLMYELDKTTGDFKLEHILYSKSDSGYPYHYRVIKTGTKISVLARVSHGSAVDYFLSLDTAAQKAALDLEMGDNTTGSGCIDLTNGSLLGDYASCFEGQDSEDKASFGAFFGLDLSGTDPIPTWTTVSESNLIGFDSVADFNNPL